MNDQNRIAVDSIITSLLDQRIENSASFKSSLRRIATWALPNINYAFQDIETGKTVVIIFLNECATENELKAYAIKALNSIDSVVVACTEFNVAE